MLNTSLNRLCLILYYSSPVKRNRQISYKLGTKKQNVWYNNATCTTLCTKSCTCSIIISHILFFCSQLVRYLSVSFNRRRIIEDETESIQRSIEHLKTKLSKLLLTGWYVQSLSPTGSHELKIGFSQNLLEESQ